MKNKQKGFTLIELLIVIAIIGILAAMLMVAINPAQILDDTADQAKRGTVAGMPADAKIYYMSNDFSFENFCDSSQVARIKLKYFDLSCLADADAFRVSIVLEDGTTHFCVDSTGFKSDVTTAPTDKACPTP